MIAVNPQISISQFVPEKDKADLIYHINDIDVARNTLTIPHPYSEADADFYFNLIQEFDLKLLASERNNYKKMQFLE
jgi:hypothetical protein